MAAAPDPVILYPSHDDDRRGPEQAEEDRTITDPGKVVRLATMAQVLLGEANAVELDEAARERLADIYERSLDTLSELLSEDLQDELIDLGLGPMPDGSTPTTPELRIAQAQLVGWLEGLFHGVRATLATQHLAQQEELAELYADSLRSSKREREDRRRTGTYL